MQKAEIISTKHNGSIHRSWHTAWVRSAEPLVLFIPANTEVKNPDGSVWSNSYDVEAHFYEKSWFNVFTLLKQEGVEWYCNIASPANWNNISGQLWFVDYDLDVYVYANGTYKVLDREEYKEHAHVMEYPDSVKAQIEAGLAELISLIEARTGPFANRP